MYIEHVKFYDTKYAIYENNFHCKQDMLSGYCLSDQGIDPEEDLEELEDSWLETL